MKLTIKAQNLHIEEGEDSFLGKLIQGATGKVTVKTPFGEQEIKAVKVGPPVEVTPVEEKPIEAKPKKAVKK